MKIKKITTIFITSIFILTQTMFVPVAALAIDYPDRPDSPDAPNTELDSPDEPDRPDAADRPDKLILEVVEDKPEEDTEPQEINVEPLKDNRDNDDDNTGDDYDDNNVGETEIKTGDADASGAISNVGNTNVASTDVTPSEAEGSGISIVNDGNSFESENTGTVILESDSATIQNNNANLNNELEVESNSGNNTASNNVGSSSIDTGDANVSGTILNSVNTNIAGAVMISEFNVVDDQLGDLILDYDENCILGCDGSTFNLQNKNNGSDSDNSAELEIIENDITFQNNDASVGNELILIANTGNNTTDKNTGGDNEIKTGDANVQGSIINFLNNNIAGNVIYGVVNIFGDLIGDIVVPDKYASSYSAIPINIENINNASGSDNSGEVLLATEEGFTQINDANIVNNLLIDANTGGNDVSKNTGGDNEVETGNVTVDASILNIANNNVIGGDWWIVLVNEAGNWIGKIFAPDGSFVGDYYAVKGGEATENDDGSINLSNNKNGSDSKNTASLEQTASSETIQKNNADIVNNISLSANTGNNSASKNTGGDNEIDTGDVNIQFNLINFVNNNFAGGNVYLTIVNVFGSWLGDFVTPGQANAEDNVEESAEPSIGGVPDNSNNNNSSDNNNNSSNSNDDNNDSSNTSNTESVLSANISNTNGNLGLSLQNKLASGVADEKLALADTSVNSITTEDEKRKINLAWALLLIPAFVVLRIVRRRFA